MSSCGASTINAGERVMLVYPRPTGTRTCSTSPSPSTCTRSPNNHIAFGYGTHFCIGANFARHELELLFGKLTA